MCSLFFFAIPISECSVGLKSSTHEIKRPSFPSDVFNMFEYDDPEMIHPHSWCPWIVTETSHPKKLSPGYHLRSRHQFLWEGTVRGSETNIAEKRAAVLRGSRRTGSSKRWLEVEVITVMLTGRENEIKLELWPEIPVISTNKTPFIDCIIPFITSYKL